MNEEQMLKMIEFLEPTQNRYCKMCIRVLKPWAALEYIEAFLVQTADGIIASG